MSFSTLILNVGFFCEVKACAVHFIVAGCAIWDPHGSFKAEYGFHSGYDMADEDNTPVYSSSLGVVIYAEYRGADGWMIEIDHGNGFRTRYGHLNRINVTVAKK